MRRGKVLSILTVLLVIAGIACIARDLRAVIGQIESDFHTFIGSTLLLLGATAGCMTLAFFRKECRRLTETLASFSNGTKPTPVDAAVNSELRPLVTSINDLVTFA